MTVSLADAAQAVRAVMSGIGRHIDPAIRATLNARRPAGGAADLFVLLDQATWQTDVTNYYNAYFASIFRRDYACTSSSHAGRMR